MAVKHGALSPSRVEPLAVDRLSALAAGVSDDAADVLAADAAQDWARNSAQRKLVAEWLDQHGPLDDEGMPRPAALFALKLASAGLKMRAELRFAIDSASEPGDSFADWLAQGETQMAARLAALTASSAITPDAPVARTNHPSVSQGAADAPRATGGDHADDTAS